MTKRTEAQTEQRAISLYQQGQTGTQIAANLAISDGTVYSILKRHGITSRPSGKRTAWVDTEVNRQALIAEYVGGASSKRLARRYRTRDTTVKQVLDDAGLDWRHPGGRRRFTDEEAQQFAAEYADGSSLADIARRHDTTQTSVREYLIRLGVTLRPPGSPLFWTEEHKAEAARRYVEGERIQDIAAAMGCNRNSACKVLTEMGIHKPRAWTKRGEAHHSWQGGRYIDNQGYVRILVTAEDQQITGRPTGYVMEHRLVMARALGRQLRPTETVHHINGDRTDNRLANLQLRNGKHGSGVRLACLDCGSHNIGHKPLD